MHTSYIIGSLKYFLSYLKQFIMSRDLELKKAGYTCLIWIDMFNVKNYESQVNILDILDFISSAIMEDNLQIKKKGKKLLKQVVE